MPPFDIQGAKDAGYSDDDIIGHLAEKSKFDVKAARDAGYSNDEILSHLTSAPAAPPAAEPGILDRAQNYLREVGHDPNSSVLAKGAAVVGNLPIMVAKGVAALPGAVANTVSDVGAAARNELTPEGMERAGRDAAMLIAPGGLRTTTPVLDSAITKAVPPSIPPMPAAGPAISRAAVKGAADSAYNTVKNSVVRISPESFQDFVDNLPSTLNDYHPLTTPVDAPKASGMLGALAKQAAQNEPMSLAELEKLRSNIGKAATKTTDDNDARLLRQISDKMKDYMGGLKDDVDLDVGEPEHLAPTQDALTSARDLWSRNKKMKNIETIVNQAARTQNPDLIQQKFNVILKNDKKFGEYAPEEQAIIQKIANNGVADFFGKAAPSTDKLLTLKNILYGATGATGFGAPLAIATGLGTSAAKAIARRGRLADVNRLQQTIAEGGGLARAMGGPVTARKAERARKAAGLN